MAEVAEAELMERLGLTAELYGSFPRVHLSVDFVESLYFRARVDVQIEVAEVGRTSATFAFVVTLEGRTRLGHADPRRDPPRRTQIVERLEVVYRALVQSDQHDAPAA